MLLRLADRRKPYAAYAFGKLFLQGDIVQERRPGGGSVSHRRGGGGNANAMYVLGKLYLVGEDVPQDKKAALRWFTQSAEQGNTYAQFYTEHWAVAAQNPSVFLSATRLLHHMSRVFQNNTPPQRGGVGYGIDKKLRRKMKEKKIAQGHKEDDQEQRQDYIIPY
jgi:TPR repeat protein